MHVLYPVVLATLLFCVGVYGVLARRTLILVLMSVELMLNAVNLNLVTFDVWLRDALHSGQVLALFVIVIAAAEVGLGLALVLQLFRSHATVAVDAARGLAERPRRGRTAALQRQAEAEPVRAEPRGGPQHAPDPEWWREHR